MADAILSRHFLYKEAFIIFYYLTTQIKHI